MDAMNGVKYLELLGWGLDEVVKEWRTGWWMRSRVRCKLAAARQREGCSAQRRLRCRSQDLI